MSKSKKPAPLDYREGEESKPLEGEEMEDTAKPLHSRKRSAKGAKNTKAPMDGEGGKGSCPCGKRPKGKCNCGKVDAGMCGMKSRSDALTAPEYLAACELGIQGRSRAYIRARLDAAERLDLKCGKGAISKGEKCTKGAAQEVTKGLRSASTRQLRSHSQLLQNDLIVKYGGMSKASADFEDFKKWATSQQEYKELRAVQAILATRSDAAERLDLKCGKGAISQGEKCRKGPATKAQGPSAGVQIGQAAKGVGLGVLEAGKWVSGYNIGKTLATGITGGKNEKASGGAKAASVVGSTLLLGPSGGLGAARRVGAFGMTDLQQHAQNEQKEKKWRRSVGYRDGATYAKGFNVDLDQLAS